MSGFHLEGAIIGPKVDRIGDAGTSSLIDLCIVFGVSFLCLESMEWCTTYDLSRLWPGDSKLQVRVFLPVAEQERILIEESVIRLTEGCQSLWGRVAVEAAFETLADGDQLLPDVEVVARSLLHLIRNVSKEHS